MRTIKFRAWDKKNRKILEAIDLFKWMNDLADNTIITQSFVADESDGAYLQLPNDFDWMQFTGLLDKNGKEIFEGDILAITLGDYVSPYSKSKKVLHGKVVWDNDHQEYLLVLGPKPRSEAAKALNFSEPFTGFYRERADVSEVIGNIYENPELLK